MHCHKLSISVLYRNLRVKGKIPAALGGISDMQAIPDIGAIPDMQAIPDIGAISDMQAISKPTEGQISAQTRMSAAPMKAHGGANIGADTDGFAEK
jgi:hypothetical protein